MPLTSGSNVQSAVKKEARVRGVNAAHVNVLSLGLRLVPQVELGARFGLGFGFGFGFELRVRANVSFQLALGLVLGLGLDSDSGDVGV